MTKSNGEEPRMGSRMERFQQGVRKRTLLAKKKVQNITKEDVKSYLFRNAFVLLTVSAVIVGESFDQNQNDKSRCPVSARCLNAQEQLSDRLIVAIQTPLHLKSWVFSLFCLFVLFFPSPEKQKQTNKKPQTFLGSHIW